MNWNQLLENEIAVNTAIAIGILFLFLIFRKIFSKYLFKLILHLTRKSPSEFLEKIWLAFEHPIRWLFVIIGIYVAAHYFPYINPANQLFTSIYRSLIVIIITWGFINLTSSSSVIFNGLNRRFNIEIDRIVIPFLSKILRVIIILISISIIAQEFDYNINGFVAGLGLGGLAFSLAAQDALKNFIGGIVIIFEKPFSIGDWILTPTVEGTIEDISFRSTKVRTFDQALVTVPNARLASENITNWSKMGKRKIEFRLNLDINTPPENIKSSLTKIKELLVNNPEIHQETILVTFDKISNTSLELFVYFFTNTIVWGEYLLIKQDINLKVLNILKEENIEIAFPAQTLYIKERMDYNNTTKSEG